MKTLLVTIRGTARYSQSRAHGLIKEGDETYDDADLRFVKEHLHCDENGMAYIPPSAFKHCLDEAAQFLSLKKTGSERYTKHFESGVAVFDPIPLNVHKDNIQFERLYMNTDGKRGGGKRGFRHYPYIEKGWTVQVPFVILDETVLQLYSGDKTKTVFEHVLRCAGMYIGIGRWRPNRRGYYGRFSIEKIEEIENEFAADEVNLDEAAE